LGGGRTQKLVRVWMRKPGTMGINEGSEMNGNQNQKLDSSFLDSDKIAETILLDYLFDADPDAPSSKENLSKGRYTLAYYHGDFYQWNTGRWPRVSNEEIDLRIVKFLQSHNSGFTVNMKQEPEIPISKNRIANIRLCLAARVLRPETKSLNQWDNIEQDAIITLSMKNGLLLLKRNGQIELIPHTPDYFTFIQLPYEYDPKTECPRWLIFLDDVMMGRADYILLLHQWLGYLLRPDLRLQKFLLCVGEGANGKGVFFELIQFLVGIENCSQVPISRFDNPFSLISTLGKMVNLTHESSGLIEEESETTLKSYTSGDRMTFERKFRDAVSDVPTAKIMVATNDLPRFNDKSQAIWRRILLVPFDKVIPQDQQIETLADDLKKELPGILNWALEGLRKLNAAGRFTIPAGSNEIMEQYRQTANPARAFLFESYEATNNGDYIPCEEIYRSYRGWCDNKGYHPLADRMFGKEVHRAFPGIERKRIGGRDARSWAYTGLCPMVAYVS
jgi:P4 family phage/plasmid primase-like protien